MLTERFRSLSRVALVCAVVALVAPPAFSGGHDVIKPGPRITVENPGRNLDYLNDEQKKIAADMEAFVARMEKKIADSVAPYSKRKDFDLKYGEYVVQVAQSDAMEKAGLYTGHSTEGLPPRIDDTYWNEYLHTDLHPSSPFVGLAHITMTLQYITDDTSVVGGNVHLARSAGKEEDFQYVKERIDEVFEKHGRDITPYREARCAGFRLEHDLTVCSGVSFYAAPLLEANWDNYVLVRDTWEAFADAIITLAEKRKDDPFTAEDKEKQEDMRRWWLRDRLFSDDFTTTVVPFELFSMATLPPEVKF
jgi:coproporphyrinogen III oxidase